MAYQASRHKRVQEVLELTDDNGNVVHTLFVDLDADTMAKQLSVKQLALNRAQKNMDNVEDGKQLEVIGNTIIDLFQAVFGDTSTQIILEFYENKYIEMCQEVLPFILNVVVPNVRKVAQESRDKVLQTYNRKQKSTFGRVK